MSKGWKVVGTIFLVALLLGAVCIAVGIFTGADYDRIYSVFDARYHVTMYLEYFQAVYDALVTQL